MSDDGAEVYVSDHEVEDDLHERSSFDDRPLRTAGRRISKRALIAAVMGFSIPGLVIAHGIWTASNARVAMASAADSSVASYRDVKSGGDPDSGRTVPGQADAAPFLPTQSGYATPSPVPRSVTHYATAAGQAAAAAAAAGAGAATTAYTGAAGSGGAATMGDMTQYTGAGASYATDTAGSYQSTSPADAAAQARIAALQAQQRQYEDALHTSSNIKVDGAPASLPSYAPTSSNAINVDVAQADDEVVRPTIHGASGPYVVAAWQRIDVVMDDAIRAAGTVSGSDGGGTAWGHLPKDVVDATGARIMFPAGSRVKLEYKSPSAGQRELQAWWSRLVYPPLPGEPCCNWISLREGDDHGIRAGDPDGADAVSVRVDDHRNKLVQVALTGAAVSVIPIALAGSPSSVLQNPNPLQLAGQGLGQRINDTANRLEDSALSVPPTLYLNAGAHVIIKLDKDISVMPYSPKG